MVKGYLPPEGPQNVHGVAYTYAQGQGAHRIRNKVVYGPEAVILCSAEGTHKVCEGAGLTEVPQEVAEDALAAYQSDADETAADVIEEWEAAGAEPAEPTDDEADDIEDDTEEAIEEADTEQSDSFSIPDDLAAQYEAGDITYRGDAHSLQALAQAYGIPSNQSADDLIEALEQVRGN